MGFRPSGNLVQMWYCIDVVQIPFVSIINPLKKMVYKLTSRITKGYGQIDYLRTDMYDHTCAVHILEVSWSGIQLGVLPIHNLKWRLLPILKQRHLLLVQCCHVALASSVSEELVCQRTSQILSRFLKTRCFETRFQIEHIEHGSRWLSESPKLLRTFSKSACAWCQVTRCV